MARVDSLLRRYRDKRDFGTTAEPRGGHRKSQGNAYVVQKHDARRLHFDFRLELDGVLKSWAVTRGPSLDPADKRLAVRTEDHPVEYGDFEGVIPEGYGAGTVLLWDRGTWRPKGDAREMLEKGALKFELDGERLRGGFALIRMRQKGKRKETRENWLLVKERDARADAELDPVDAWTRSVASGRGLDEIAAGKEGTTKRDAPDGAEAKATDRKQKGRALSFVAPQLATLRDEAPAGDEWLHEVKFDGYRLEALVDGGTARLLTRNGKDWTGRYPAVADAVAALDVETAILDGELIAIDDNGHGSFAMLQNAGQAPGTELRYYAFDLLHLDGEDLRRRPLSERKERLREALGDADAPLVYSDHIAGEGDRVFAKACAMGLEGIVSKRADAAYRSGRGRAWIKSKCVNNDEFVIGGYRKSDKRGRPFASLLLGEHVDGRLVYRGRVGTGFDERTFRDVAARMKPLERKTSPFAGAPREAGRDAVWLTPRLVGQIAYAEQTTDGRLRHPRFLGLREDKPAGSVTADTRAGSTRAGTARAGSGGAGLPAGVRLTHPDRVMYPEQGATKRQVAEYLFENAARMLPFLEDRPVSLVRCPSGRQDKCFFQKHHNASVPDELETADIAEKSGKRAPYLVVRSPAGLVAAAQIGALELHVWGARTDRIERPERVVFDLDPDESLAFETVREAAREIRDVLSSMDLRSYPLLTGGKGIHVIVPIERRSDWADVKSFSEGVARKLSAAAPDRYVAGSSKARRKGRIFIDWLRNERGATAVAPYSLRAKPGAPVATPVSWKELSRVDSAAAYTLDNIAARLSRLGDDPWDGYGSARQSITQRHLHAVSDGT